MSPDILWHTLESADALQRLDSSESGLSEAEVTLRRRQHGANELDAEPHSRWPAVLLRQFRNLLMIILLLAAGLSVFLGDWVESVAIVAIVLMSVILGFVQEFRAERAIAALREMAAPTARVLRDGHELRIPARDLVPGDIVLIVTGDIVAADGRILEASNLKADEAPLTGESVPVDKSTGALSDTTLPIGDRSNMLYAGTAVTYGRGRMLVTATGMASEFGKVAGLVQTVKAGLTPLQVQINRIGRWLGVLALLVIVLITLTGLQRQQGLFEMFLFGIALAVAVVPEALPAVITISLALGVQRMARRHALVRHLPAVETLGSTSVICADKTGTLTRNEMTARRIYAGGQNISVSGSGYATEGVFLAEDGGKGITEPLAATLRAAALASDARLIEEQGAMVVRGDPTEAALVVAAAKAGLDKGRLEQECPRIAEQPFESAARRMTTLHRCGDSRVAYIKGAPEAIVAICSKWLTDDGEAALEADHAQAIYQSARNMAGEALRVIALARRGDVTLEECDKDLVFLGLIGMSDPPRAEVRQAVATCKSAGIRPIVMTGDHPDTARAIAQELDILDKGEVITGPELSAMDEQALARRVTDIDVYARVDPAHKLRIIEAWQKHGKVVAMTGDGVNDAPALKRADVGVAMGIRGTDVSRAAASMILTDDNFASIVGAVEEGRVIFANIRKYLMYLLSSNIGEIGLIAGATLAGLPLPLTAVQILYINLATDGFPALGLSVDPPDENLMTQVPRAREEGVFSRPTLLLMLIGGFWSTLVNFSLFKWVLESGRGLSEAMTMTFISLVLIQFFKAYSFRSVAVSVFRRPFANKWLNLAIVWELILLSLIVYLPILHEPFGTFALSVRDWGLAGAVAFTVVPVLEIAKYALTKSSST